MSARSLSRGPVLALVGLAMGACGEEIDSKPRAEGPAPAAARVPGGAPPPAAAPLPQPAPISEPAPPAGFRTHLYAERDADVFALLDENTSAGSAAAIESIHAELGDRVRGGQTLAVLDDARPALAVQAAQARADEVAAQLDRTAQLLEKGYATPAEHQRLKHELSEAEADLAGAHLDLSRTRVQAPFAGVVARRYVRIGERVDATTPLFRITAMSPLRARLLVPEAQAGAFRSGTAVEVTGLDGTRALGRVVLVAPVVDAGSGTREVVVELAGGSGLLPGGEVGVRLAPVVDGPGDAGSGEERRGG
ncbi:MAG: efflux RND transporter periplasmic adaptor subunit [Gemmatimonadota bacterium]